MRVQNRMIRFFVAAAALLAVALTAGCGSKEVTPDEIMPNEFAGAPAWVLEGCSAYWGDEGARICGVGSAKVGANIELARQKAGARARAEISRTLETKVRNMVKDYQEQVTDGESEMNAEQFTATTVTLSKATLNGTTQQATWISNSGQLYMLFALDVESFNNSVREMDEMSDSLRRFIEARSAKSFQELDEQMEDY